MKLRSKTKKTVIICAAAMMLSSCSFFGGEAETKVSSETELMETEAEPSLEDLEAEEPASLKAAQLEPAASLETYPETLASEEGEERDFFGIMHATITEVITEEGGTMIYTFMDKNDTENVWAIPSIELGDVLIDPVSGTDTAILFCGDIINDSDNVDFVVMLPEGEYDVERASGVTTENAMSTFAISTDGGEELIFLKDNCEIEEGSLENDSGDRITVYYARSREDGSCYPFKVYAD